MLLSVAPDSYVVITNTNSENNNTACAGWPGRWLWELDFLLSLFSSLLLKTECIAILFNDVSTGMNSLSKWPGCCFLSDVLHKKLNFSQAWWCTPVNSRRLREEDHKLRPGWATYRDPQQLSKTLSGKKNKRVGDVAQCLSTPGFIPQYQNEMT